ncbi:hypothetical protein [uncultured Alsobacter sp.]|uniref:hypothetical protein n=1 Tax=uncultured Alsobacter sp. TaxID=1748258 RepID=UPI0025EBC82F|nr:hypothetical protein [uncultured Alsobacter sp.]
MTDVLSLLDFSFVIIGAVIAAQGLGMLVEWFIRAPHASHWFFGGVVTVVGAIELFLGATGWWSGR